METKKESLLEPDTELRNEIERLSRELAAAQQERSQSASYGLLLLNEKETLSKKYVALEASYEQSKRDLSELREAWNKAVNDQRVSASTVFEKEVQLLNDSDALAASFTIYKQEIEKELRQTKSQLDSAITDKDRYLSERDDLLKKISSLEQERKNLKVELKDLKTRETKLFNENSELEEENVGLQKQVSNLRSTQVEFESSKHEIQRLQDELAALNSQLEEMLTLKRISERQMQEALEAMQSEREQKYALRKELDKRTSSNPLINLSSLVALKGSSRLANLALRGYGSPNRSSERRETEDSSPNGFSDQDTGAPFGFSEQSYDMIHELEMPSIEGSLFDEVHLTEIKKLQQNLKEEENHRSNLSTKLIEIQHKLDSKTRQFEEIEKKLVTICSLVEDIFNDSCLQKEVSTNRKSEHAVKQVDEDTNDSNDQQPSDALLTTNEITNLAPTTNSTKPNILDDFENIYSHLQTIFNEFKSYQQLSVSNKANKSTKDPSQATDMSLIEQAISEVDNKVENIETLQSDDVQSLRVMLLKKHEQLKQLRHCVKSNKDSGEVALKNLKTKYNMEKAINTETMTKLKLELKRLNEDAATFASLRSHFSARIEEYNTEIEKLQSKLSASEQEKNTLNSILRMAIEQKVILNQKLEALEMDREDPHMSGSTSGGKNANGQHQRSAMVRGRGSMSRSARPPRGNRPSGNERR